MSEADKLLDEIMKTRELFYKIDKPVSKIKMKLDFYDKLVTQIQRDYKIIEVLDVNNQPLNTFNGIKIEINNDIKKDYEIIYD